MNTTKYLNEKTQKITIDQLKMMSYYIMKMTSIAFYKPENITIIETFLFLKYCNYQMYEIYFEYFEFIYKIRMLYYNYNNREKKSFWI